MILLFSIRYILVGIAQANNNNRIYFYDGKLISVGIEFLIIIKTL